ncbi:MAG TPA: YoaK family protein [Candidatus Baltobacteraceae bacterium]|nr:YoaK family protein [Candidatus Baltobacteraceae bacterium]
MVSPERAISNEAELDLALSGLAVPVRRVVALGFVAGCVDALGVVDLHGVYTAAMTGNTTQLGIAFVRGEWPRFALTAWTLAAFFGGGLLGSIIRRHLRRPAFELLIMAGVLLLAGAIRMHAGPLAFVELSLLAIAMAMQGQTVSRFGGLSIQTIVVTNTILKFADGLIGRYTPLRTRSETADTAGRRADIADVIVPACAWLAYMVGAGIGAAAATGLQFPLLVPVVVLALTACDLLLTSSPAHARQGDRV